MAQRLGAGFWQRHLDGWKRSGLTQVAYCARHGVSIKTFTRWRSKALKDGQDGPAALTLVPVSLSRSPIGGGIQIHSPGGWRIELTGSVAELADLLKSLP